MAGTLRVLYVDDEPDLLDICRIFLEDTGDFSVVTYDSAPVALELLANEQFDAIISDYQMPGMDGIEFLKKVRGLGNTIPFILFTGKGREEVVIEALNEGADFYLQKGGDPEAQFAELTHKVRLAVSNKKAVGALKKSEEKYRQLIEHANEAIVVAQDGMLKLVNQRAIEVTGYSEQELLSRPFSDIINPIDRAMVMERYQKRLNGEELPNRYPFRVVSKEGSTCWVELSAVVIDWDGRPATLNFLSDVTKRKKAEEAQRESEEVLTAMLNGITESALMMSPDGTILAANETVAKRLGQQHGADLVGQNAIALLPMDIRETRQKKVDEVLNSGQPVHFEDIRNDRIIDQTLYPVGGPDGSVNRLVVFGIDITDRKAAEEALVVSEERFRLITETIDEAFWMADVDIGKMFYVSPSFERIWGRSRESLYKNPRSFIDAIHIEDRERVLVNLEIQKSGLPFDHEYRILHPDGNIRYIWDRGYPIRDENGKVSRYVGVAVDVTDRKQTERALAESEELFRSVVHNSSDLTILTDANGTTTYVSPQCERVLGYPAEEILGQVIPDFIHPNDIARCRETWEQVAHQGLTLREFEYRIIDGQGAVRWVSHSASQMVVNGRVLGMQNTIRDITERKEAENQIQNSGQLLQTVIDNSQYLIYAKDLKGRFIMASQSLAGFFGCRHDQLMGKTSHDFLPKAIADQHWDNDLEVMARKSILHIEEIAEAADGIHTFLSAKFPLVDAEGRMYAVCGASVDITERKKAEEVLRESSERYKTLITVSNTGAWEYYRDRDYLWCSPEYFSMLGRDASQFDTSGAANIKEIWTDLLHPDDRDRAVEYFTWYLADNPPGIYENHFRMQHADGHWVWIWSRGSKLRDKEGNLSGMTIGTHIDITNSMREEQALMESEARYRLLAENSTDVIWTLDLDGVFTYVSPSVFQLRGYTPEEVMQQTLRDSLSKGSVDTVQETLRQSLEDVKPGFVPPPTVIELEQPCKDGSSVWTEVVSRFLCDAAGKPNGVIGISRNITKRRKAEETLRNSERLYQLLAESSPDMIFLVDHNGVVQYVSPLAAQAFGGVPADFIGKRTDMVYPREIARHFMEEINLVVSAKEPRLTEVLEQFPGGARWVNTRLVPIIDPAGGVIQVLGISTDVTERRQAEDSLLKINQKLNVISQLTRKDLANQIFVLHSYL